MSKNIQTITLNKKNIKNFAAERNSLLNKSMSDWNLFLDFDEKLSKKINQLSSKSLNQYALIRKNYFLGQYIGTDKIIRLVKKGTGIWKRAVHELWIANDPSSVGTIDSSYIIHNTADNLSDYLVKINNYSTIHARENKKEGKTSSIFKIIFYPIGKFVVTLIKSKNVVFSIMQSLHSFLSWSKLYFGQF